jgi:homoserine kinase
LNRGEVFKKATKHEGHPDNAGPATFGGLFLHAGVPKRLPFHKDLGVALAVPGQEISTHEARGLIPAQLSRADAIGQASSAAALVAGLTTGDGKLVRHGMIDRIAVPVRRGLIDGYDKAVEAGLEAGAFGVTISGAGSTLVAICPLDVAQGVAEAIAEELTAQGNPARALHPSMVETGVEILKGKK